MKNILRIIFLMLCGLSVGLSTSGAEELCGLLDPSDISSIHCVDAPRPDNSGEREGSKAEEEKTRGKVARQEPPAR